MLIGMSFLVSLSVIVMIGAGASRLAKKETVDYLLAGRSLPPWLAAFSSAATNNSGYMFIGLVGYAYSSGVEAIWLQLGWVAGDIMAWRFVHLPVRKSTGEIEALSVPSWLGTTPAGNRLRGVVLVSALLTFLFLSGYAGAQLKASSVGLSVLFGWHESIGICLSAAVVVLYCFSGGFRASVWTDAAQSLVMFISMVILVATAWYEVGGLSSLWTNLAAQDSELVRLLPTSATGTALLFFGYVVGGAMAVGQPHILTRTMALRSVKEFYAARRFYFLWLIPLVFPRHILTDLENTLNYFELEALTFV
jgi:sodium/proline symporter